MAKWIGSAALAATMMFGICAVSAPATAASADVVKAQTLNPHRQIHQYRRYAYRPYPTYYGRPVHYAPAPFLPIPPLWGYGWEWW